MIIYNYDPKTKEFIGSSEANLDELESEIQGKPIYRIPNYATDIPNLVPKEGYAQCFDESGHNWNYLEDNRGKVVYNDKTLEPLEIDFLGPIPVNYLIELPKPKNKYEIWKDGNYTYPELNVLKLQIKQDLDNKYNLKLEKLYRVNQYYVQPKWASIYTTTLVAMQQDLQEDGKLDEKYRVLLIEDPSSMKFYHCIMESVQEFMPYYNRVKDLYKQITEDYHDKIIRISSAESAELAVSIILNY